MGPLDNILIKYRPGLDILDCPAPTASELGAWIAARPYVEAVALLRVILEANPTAAVEAVDTAKVARPWSPAGEDEMRLPLGRGSLGAGFAGPLGEKDPGAVGEWMFGRPGGWGRAPNGEEARAASDAAWKADGWALASGKP